jgi:hypothetical protein
MCRVTVSSFFSTFFSSFGFRVAGLGPITVRLLSKKFFMSSIRLLMPLLVTTGEDSEGFWGSTYCLISG